MYIINFRVIAQILASSLLSRYRSIRFLLFVVLWTPCLVLSRFLFLPFQFLDYLLYSDFADARIEEPLFIVSAPRSGSTFLHRLLVQDPQFVSIKLWHTIFPSIALYKFFGWIARLESQAPWKPFQWLLDRIDRTSFSGWDDIHASGLRLHEEDEQWWVQIFASPVGLMLFYPFLSRYPSIHNLDQLPESTKQKLSHYILRCYQRFMYINPGKKLLAKNAVSGGRIGLYKRAFPDMQTIYIERSEQESIPSALSMFTKPWKFHSPHLYGASEESREFVKLLLQNTKGYEDFVAQERDRAVRIPYRHLVTEPARTVESIYADLQLELHHEYLQTVYEACQVARTYKSKHRYSLEQFGLSERDIQDIKQSQSVSQL